MNNVEIQESNREIAEEIKKFLKDKHPNKNITKRSLKVLFELPHVRSGEVWTEISRDREFIVKHRTICYKIKEPTLP